MSTINVAAAEYRVCRPRPALTAEGVDNCNIYGYTLNTH
jgi:hypothetical protein